MTESRRRARRAVSAAMENLDLGDENDFAFRAGLASLMNAWQAGEAERLLHKMRLATNREMELFAPNLEESRN